MMKRKLGRSGVEVSALGMGCWAIGGPHSRGGSPVGWGQVNDAESTRALRTAFDLGCTFYDTADVYGCGHSENILREALGDKRDEIVIATKAGYTYVEETREAPGESGDPDYIRRCCDESLRRLGTDYIDLYQFHLGGYPLEKSADVLAVFDALVDAGKVRSIGWSTDDPARAELFAQSPRCVAIQQGFNLFGGNEVTLAVCEKFDLASILRGPLGMGMLTGKFDADTALPADDIRRGWNFKEGGQADTLKKVESLRAVRAADQHGGARRRQRGKTGKLRASGGEPITINRVQRADAVEHVGAGHSVVLGRDDDIERRRVDARVENLHGECSVATPGPQHPRRQCGAPSAANRDSRPWWRERRAIVLANRSTHADHQARREGIPWLAQIDAQHPRRQPERTRECQRLAFVAGSAVADGPATRIGWNGRIHRVSAIQDRVCAGR